MTWESASVEWVVGRFRAEVEQLHPFHQDLLRPLLVAPYTVAVEAHPGETVVVVAEHAGSVLYWSDVEEGWELEPLTESGGISDRGCNQFELRHIAHRLFGAPPNAS